MRKQEQQMRSFAIGMNSTVDIQRDLHIIGLDYDILDLKLVEESVIEVQQFWCLTDAYIFKTKHGYHAIIFHSLVPYERLRQIVDFAKFVDGMYKYISRYYSHKTLRVAGKYKERDIHFEKIIKGVREPSEEEFELGEMKRREHASMIGG
jgi:hypothetical protein